MQKKYALVTGGSRGIGRAVCVKLAEQGYHILINYKSNEAEALKTAELVAARQATCQLLPFDVASRDEVATVLGGWIAANTDSQIEILVNNAGIRNDALMVMMQDDQWDSVIDTNLQGMYHVTRQVLKQMLLSRYGRIINIVSLSGITGLPGQVNYSAAKAGIIGATKALALEVAKRNVTVNAVAPGFIKTDMLASTNEKELIEQVPMKRFGLPEEVADLVGFLASRQASYITGQVISINGGIYT